MCLSKPSTSQACCCHTELRQALFCLIWLVVPGFSETGLAHLLAGLGRVGYWLVLVVLVGLQSLWLGVFFAPVYLAFLS